MNPVVPCGIHHQIIQIDIPAVRDFHARISISDTFNSCQIHIFSILNQDAAILCIHQHMLRPLQRCQDQLPLFPIPSPVPLLGNRIRKVQKSKIHPFHHPTRLQTWEVGKFRTAIQLHRSPVFDGHPLIGKTPWHKLDTDKPSLNLLRERITLAEPLRSHHAVEMQPSLPRIASQPRSSIRLQPRWHGSLPIRSPDPLPRMDPTIDEPAPRKLRPSSCTVGTDGDRHLACRLALDDQGSLEHIARPQTNGVSRPQLDALQTLQCLPRGRGISCLELRAIVTPIPSGDKEDPSCARESGMASSAQHRVPLSNDLRKRLAACMGLRRRQDHCDSKEGQLREELKLSRYNPEI